jgi:hypothetical protein
MKVSVVPFYNHFLNNRLFKHSESIPEHWQQPQLDLKRACEENGIEIGTWDVLPPACADVLLFFDPPAKHAVLQFFKSSFPKAKLALVLYETPLGPHWFNPRNHEIFDAVFTYNSKLVDDKKYFEFKLPIAPFSTPDLFQKPFAQRKTGVLVNTNRYKSALDLSRPWHIAEIDLLKSGWRYGVGDLLRIWSRDKCAERRRLARFAEKRFPEYLDVYGARWEGLNNGWFRRFFPDKPYGCARGFTNEGKLELISRYRFTFCFENYASDEGYISEKIFDALYAGSVPIYLGEKNITRHIPQECFVNATEFPNYFSLFQKIIAMDARSWQTYRDAAWDYLNSRDIKKFQSEAYSKAFVEVFKKMRVDA